MQAVGQPPTMHQQCARPYPSTIHNAVPAHFLKPSVFRCNSRLITKAYLRRPLVSNQQLSQSALCLSKSTHVGRSISELQSLYRNVRLCAARKGKSTTPSDDQEPGAVDAPLEEDLLPVDSMTYAQLRSALKELELPSSGNTTELRLRLAEARNTKLAQQEAEQTQALARQAKQAGTSVEADSDVTKARAEADVKDLIDELETFSEEELLACLQDRGDTQAGSKDEMIKRLADLIVNEAEMEVGSSPAPSKAAVGDDDQLSLPLSEEDKAILVEAKSFEGQERMKGNTRQALFNSLKSAGVRTPYLGKDVLLVMLANEMAVQEVQAMELAAYTDPAALAELSGYLNAARIEATAAASDAADDAEDAALADETAAEPDTPEMSLETRIAQMQSREIRSMKVKDIRELLDSLKLPSYGNRYEMQERLALEVANAQERQRRAASGTGAGLPLSIREMRKRLAELGLTVTGTRIELEARLAEYARVSLEMMVDATRQANMEREGSERVLDPRAQLLLGYEPCASVAVICAWPEGDLIQAEACLVAARTLVDQLQTAPLSPLSRAAPGPSSSTHLQSYMQSLLATDDEFEDAEAATGADTSAPEAVIEEQETVISSSSTPSNGVSVQVFFLDATGRPRLLTAGELFSCSAQDLVLLGRPTLGSVRAGVAGLLSDEQLGLEAFENDGEGGGSEADDVADSNVGFEQPLLSDGQTATDQTETGETGGVEASGEAQADEAAGDAAAEDVGLDSFVAAAESSWNCPATLEELAVSLWDAGVDVVVPIVSPSCSAAGAVLYEEVVGALEQAGLAVVGSTPQAAAAASDKWSVRETLQAMNYPTLPAYKMDVLDLGDVHAWAAGLQEWCEEQGWDSSYQRFVVKPARGLGAQSVITVLGLEQLASTAAALMQSLVPDYIPPTITTSATLPSNPSSASDPSALPPAEASPTEASDGSDPTQELDEDEEYESGCAVIIEPLLSSPDAFEFSVVVIQSPSGPVALMPHELELYDADREISISALDHAHWGLSQEGLQPEVLSALMVEMKAQEMSSHRDVVQHGRHYPQTQQLKYHSPPRLSHATIHHIRHAACKLFLEMGLSDVARIDGWAAPDPEWTKTKGGTDMDVPTLPDPDPFILQRMMTERAMVNLNDPTPLSEYYDAVDLHSAELDLFDPTTRLFSVVNKQATIFFTDVNVDVGAELGPGGLLFMQAAEVGMVPAAAIRNVLNSALRRSGSLLELPAPPLFPSDLSALRLNVYPDSFVDETDFPHPAIGEPRGDGLEDILTAFQAGFKDDRAPDEDEESEGGFDGEAGEGEEEFVDEEMDWDELNLSQKERLFRMDPELWEEDDSAVRQAYDEAVDIMNAVAVKEQGAAVTVLAPTRPMPAISSLTSKARPAQSHTQQQEQSADTPAATAEDEEPTPTTTALHSSPAPSSEQQPVLSSEGTSHPEIESVTDAPESQAVIDESTEQEAAADAADIEEEYEYVDDEDYEEEEEFESMGVDETDERSLEQIQAEELDQELSPRAILIAVLEAQADDDSEAMEVRLGMGKFAVLYDCHADLSNLEARALLVYTGSPDAREADMVRLAGRDEFISINTDASVNDDEVDADELLYFGAEDDGENEAEEAEQEGEAQQPLRSTQLQSHDVSSGLDTGSDDDGGDDDRNTAQGDASREQHSVQNDVPYGPMRVWVLMGGDGAERHASLAAGRAVMSGMSKFRDAIVEPFVLAPSGRGADEQRRRAALLARRNTWLELGFDEAGLPDLLQLDEIRTMTPLQTTLENEPVWAVPMAAVMRGTVEEAVEVCERVLARTNVASHSLAPLDAQVEGLQEEVQAELMASGLVGVCGLWDSDYTMQPLNPRALNLSEFAAEAAKHNAVVYLGALPGRLGEDGTVVAMLEAENVMATGCSSMACMATYDRSVLSEILSELPANLGVQCLPSVDVPVQHLLKAAQHEDTALDLMDTMRDMLQSGQLAIRPLCGSSSTGVARLSLYSDMYLYCTSLAERLPELAANSLSRPHAPIPFHTFLPSTFIVEPYMGTDPVIVTRQHSHHHAGSSSSSSTTSIDESPSSNSSHASTSDEEVSLRVDWIGLNPWVRVCMGLMGNVGAMEPFMPSVQAFVKPEDDRDTFPTSSPAQPESTTSAAPSSSQETTQAEANSLSIAESEPEQQVVPYTSAEVESFPVTWITPAPPSILPHDVVLSAQMRARVVADRLGLSGLCQLDCMVHAGTGEMFVININPCPLLSADSPLLRQALLLQPPMLPSDLVRATVLLAVQHSEAEESRSEGEGGMTGSSTMDVYNEEDERASMLEDLERLRDKEEGYGGPGGQGDEEIEAETDIL